MSCWRRTTVLRIPAIALGFTYFREWEQYLPLYRKLFPDFTLHRIDDHHGHHHGEGHECGHHHGEGLDCGRREGDEGCRRHHGE